MDGIVGLRLREGAEYLKGLHDEIVEAIRVGLWR